MQKKSQNSWYSTFFAYFVLFIALLHFFVYTSCCTNVLVQEYLLRESENIRRASLENILVFLISPELIDYLLQLERRTKKEEEKLLSEADSESASSTSEKPESSSPPSRLSQTLSGISFTFFLTLAPPPSGAAAAAAAIAY